MSALSAFNNRLVEFFDDMSDTYPEEKDIKGAAEALKALKKINPKMILDLFKDYVYDDLNEPIQREDEEYVLNYAKKKISNNFNEMSPALIIFDKHWATMTEQNQKAIWYYLKVLCILCRKALDARNA